MRATDIKTYLTGKNIPSTDLIIYKDHKEIFRFIRGYGDYEKTRPLTGDEYYYLYSASKVITCTAAMRLVERGLLDLSAPVSKYIPEFANLTVNTPNGVQKCENVLYVHDLFSMTGGLNYNLNTAPILEVKRETNNKAGTLEIVKAFTRSPLDFEPGTRFQYSLCHDVIGALIEVVSGMSFGDYLKKNIFDPLGMENTGFFPTEEQLKKFAAEYRYNDKTKGYDPVPVGCAYRLSDNYESGGAGLFSTVNDYALFADAVACWGKSKDGYQVIKPETIKLMRTNQLNPTDLKNFWRPGYGYAYGVRTMVNTEAAETTPNAKGEYGWDGAAGAYVAIDPENALSVFYAQHVLGHGWVYSETHPTIRDCAYRIAGLWD